MAMSDEDLRRQAKRVEEDKQLSRWLDCHSQNNRYGGKLHRPEHPILGLLALGGVVAGMLLLLLARFPLQ